VSAPSDTRRDNADGEYAGQSRAPLDVMLTDAALGAGSRWNPGSSPLKLVAGLARRPRVPARRAADLAVELAKIAAGRSEVAPGKKDNRFRDPAWTANPLYKRLCQSYLAAGGTLEALVDDAELDWRSEQRLSFLVANLVDALAPSNLPIQPAALKAAIDTGGRNFVTGGRQLVRDLSRRPRIPQMVDTTPFEVGKNIAVTPGAVVLRTPVIELLQYAPSTPRVHKTPLLIVPPMINKFYVADLAPGRSMIEYFLGSGQPVFTISWRNPTEEHRDWNLDTYVQGVLDALAATRSISGSERSHVLGLCAGGITTSVTLGHLAATGELDRIASLTLGVTVVDQERAGTVGSFVDRRTAQLAVAQSQRQGYLDGRTLAGVFAWLRPNDLVWNYWVNNYLLGKPPPAFDVLFWNNDVTRMPAGLHRDFIRLAVDNALVTPGKVSALGTPVDLSKVAVDLYAVAGIADHITPWHNCYRSLRLFGSTPRFILSTSGHIAALVNPADNPKASFQVNDGLPADPDAWLAGAVTHRGSWWPDYTAWLAERSGGERDAPTGLGSAELPPLGPAPGSYVHET
jgi:polyhydroxyalkanoate synthase